MWKVGDKIKFIKNGIIDSNQANGFNLNQIYTIVKKIYDSNSDFGDSEGYKYLVEKYSNCTWWIEPNSFKKVTKRKSKKESAILDRIQENFKNGY